MGYLMHVSLIGLVAIISCQAFRPFWRKPTPPPTPPPTLLPPINQNPEFYRKLREEIPPKEETAKKVVNKVLRINRGGKRQVKLEDAIIVMDGSGSIGGCEFNNGKKAMKPLMKFVQTNIDSKYAMVTFASRVRKDFDFLPQLDAAAKIDAVTFPSGSTNTQAGLAEALKIFNAGSRVFSRKLVLLLTDGRSNVNSQNTIPNAQKLKDKGVEVFVIAVGGKHISGIDEMAHIATYPPKDYLFRVEKVGDFFEVVKLAIKEVAPQRYEIIKNYKSSCP